MSTKTTATYLIIISLIIIFPLSACKKGSNPPKPPPKENLPDLTFTGHYDFKFERTLPPTGNDLYTFAVEVRNQGSAPAQSVQVIAYSKGPGLRGPLEPLENNGYYSINVEQTVQAKFQFIFEKQFFGEYEFTITIDPSNAVREINKTNNRFVFKRVF
jgi:hypothetical protein